MFEIGGWEHAEPLIDGVDPPDALLRHPVKERGGMTPPRCTLLHYCLQIFQMTPVPGICSSGPFSAPTK